MKKIKDPDAKRLQKLRSALRSVWQYDSLRKAVITAVVLPKAENCSNCPTSKCFTCPICKVTWPIALATVDHFPPIGAFTLETIGEWINKLFFGPQRAICKPCHAKVTAQQRRKL